MALTFDRNFEAPYGTTLKVAPERCMVRSPNYPRIGALAVLLGLALGGGADAQQTRAPADFSPEQAAKAEVQTADLGHGLYLLRVTGGPPSGNITLAVGEDAALMVDASYAAVSDKVKAAIARITSAPLRFVIDSHFHDDHTNGNESFFRAGAILVGQENVRKRLMIDTVSGESGKIAPAKPNDAWPTLTYADRLTLHIEGQTADLRHPGPGHTDGDTFVFFPEANVLAAGDCFTTNGYPFIDVNNGGNIDGDIAFLDAMIAVSNEATKIVPGHGALQSKADLVAYRGAVAAARDRVAKFVAEGKSLEETIAAKPLAGLDAAVTHNVRNAEQNADQFVGYAYRSLKGG